MAEDTQGASPKNDAARPSVDAKEDAETRAARRELKQSSISDPSPDATAEGAKDRPATPADDAADAKEDQLKEQVASPKKKRAHDQLDQSKDDDQNDAASVASADSAKDRASRLEPEKKRPRDQDGGAATEEDTKEKTDAKTDTDKAAETTKTETTAAAPSASSSAFAASGFGKLATGASPFSGLGDSKSSGFGLAGKPTLSSFASGASKTSSDAAPAAAAAAPAAAPKLSFGGAGNASPFGGLPAGTNGFGSGAGTSSFASFGAAKPLSTFGAAGGASRPFQSQKPAKPFGAPESDVEESDEGEQEEETESAAEADRGASPEKDQEKKLKLHKVDVDDGETSEVAILSVRAKMFVHEKEAGWKERGAGMLKVNVPRSCVEFDDNNAVVAGSFDASGLDEEDEESSGPKVVRLVMRQDNTHRVILNTAVVPAMKFQEKTTLKSVAIIFTAFEGPEAKPVTVTMRMSTANGKNFLSEVENVQRELQNR